MKQQQQQQQQHFVITITIVYYIREAAADKPQTALLVGDSVRASVRPCVRASVLSLAYATGPGGVPSSTLNKP